MARRQCARRRMARSRAWRAQASLRARARSRRSSSAPRPSLPRRPLPLAERRARRSRAAPGASGGGALVTDGAAQRRRLALVRMVDGRHARHDGGGRSDRRRFARHIGGRRAGRDRSCDRGGPSRVRLVGRRCAACGRSRGGGRCCLARLIGDGRARWRRGREIERRRELGRLRFGCGRHVGRRRDRFGLMIIGGRLDRRLRRDRRRRARRLIRSRLRRVLHGVDLARQLVEAPHALGIGELVPVGAIERQRARGLERSDFSLMREPHRREQADRRHSQERGRQARADHKPEIRQHALTVSRQGLGACRGIADARPGPCHVEAGMPPSVIRHVNA